MIFAWFRSLMGQWGMNLLIFYLENSFWLNLLVLAYGAWVTLSWINLKNIRSALIQSLVGQIRVASGAPLTEEEAAALAIPWERVVSEARFPFVAHQMALLPRRLSVKVVQEMLPVEDLATEALRITKFQEKKQKA